MKNERKHTHSKAMGKMNHEQATKRAASCCTNRIGRNQQGRYAPQFKWGIKRLSDDLIKENDELQHCLERQAETIAGLMSQNAYYQDRSESAERAYKAEIKSHARTEAMRRKLQQRCKELERKCEDLTVGGMAACGSLMQRCERLLAACKTLERLADAHNAEDAAAFREAQGAIAAEQEEK